LPGAAVLCVALFEIFELLELLSPDVRPVLDQSYAARLVEPIGAARCVERAAPLLLGRVLHDAIAAAPQAHHAEQTVLPIRREDDPVMTQRVHRRPARGVGPDAPKQ